jgi:hypothetical protein
MPLLQEAIDFVNAPQTSGEQLRIACEILDEDTTGGEEALRERLNRYLTTWKPSEPIVCLSPISPPNEV